MSNQDSVPGTGRQTPSEGWKTAVTMLQDAAPISVPEGASAMTLHVEWEPGDLGTPPHRHSGPAFGYVIEGAVRFELEGEPERVVEAGGTFWEPGGDPIHYQDGNALADARTRFVVARRLPYAVGMTAMAWMRNLGHSTGAKAGDAVTGVRALKAV